MYGLVSSMLESKTTPVLVTQQMFSLTIEPVGSRMIGSDPITCRIGAWDEFQLIYLIE